MAARKASLAACVLSVAALTVAQGPDYSQIYADNEHAVLFIEAVGHLFNGTTERMTGTGFFVSDSGAIVTNDHVTFRTKTNYKQIEVTVRAGSRRARPQPARIEWTNRENDLTILRLHASGSVRRVTLGHSASQKIGARIAVMGFPLTSDLSIVDGLISSMPAPNRWQTNAALNLGNSGGPVFNAAGEVIGVVTSGVVSADAGAAGMVDVDGIGYFIPIDFMGTDVSPDAVKALLAGSASRPARAPPVQRLTRGYSISQVKDDHPVVFGPHTREYIREFIAEPRFRMTSARVDVHSGNFVSGLRTEIREGGRLVTVHFTLTSGPAINRYRGWLHATLITEQEREGVS